MRLAKYCVIGITGVLFIFFLSVLHPSPAVDEYAGYERRFTFVCPLKWDYSAYGMEEAAKKYGVSMKYIRFERLNAEEQAEAIQEAIFENVDGIITAGMEDSEGLKEVIREARRKGIPLVLIDNDLEDSERTCYVGCDNYRVGEQAGSELAKEMEAQAKIGIVVSTLEAPNQAERVEGFQSALRSYPGMEVVDIQECYSNRMLLYEKVPKMLKEHPEINALYLTEGVSSAYTGEVLESLDVGKEEIKIVFVDGMGDVDNAIRREQWYLAGFQQNHYAQGYEAVETLYRYLEGETVDDCIYTDFTMYTKDNVNEVRAEEAGEIVWHQY